MADHAREGRYPVVRRDLLELAGAAFVGGIIGAGLIYLGLAWFLGGFRRP
jgi:hypothetical protein